MLSVICQMEFANNLKEIIVEETGSLGIRYQQMERSVLERIEHSVETEYGTVAGKLITLPNGGKRFVPEYESCAAIADKSSCSLEDVFQSATKEFSQSR